MMGYRDKNDDRWKDRNERREHAEDGWLGKSRTASHRGEAGSTAIEGMLAQLLCWENLPRAPHPNPRTVKQNQRDGRGGRVPAAVHVHGMALVCPGRFRGHGLGREMKGLWQEGHLFAPGGRIFIGRRGHGLVLCGCIEVKRLVGTLEIEQTSRGPLGKTRLLDDAREEA